MTATVPLSAPPLSTLLLCNERTVGLHAVAEQLRQGRGCRNRIRNQQDEKRASQAHASLRSLWRATMILLSKTSPAL